MAKCPFCDGKLSPEDLDRGRCAHCHAQFFPDAAPEKTVNQNHEKTLDFADLPLTVAGPHDEQGASDFRATRTMDGVSGAPPSAEQSAPGLAESPGATQTFDSGGGPYCQQCGKCVSQCRRGLDIPTTMRAYMYAHGYDSPQRARETLSSAGITPAACEDCGTCPVRCAMGSDIRLKMRDMARLARA